MRITEAEHELRKKRMLYAAYELFCQNDIDGVSMAQIAKEAGVSPNSVFRYFDNKTELVKSTQIILWEEVTTRILEDSGEYFTLAKNGLQEVGILLYHFGDLYTKHGKYILFACDYKLFMVRNHIMMSEKTYIDMIAPIYRTFIASIKKGQADGSIDNSKDADILFFAIWGVIRGYVDEIVLYDRIYEGKNPWKGQFSFILKKVIDALMAET